MPLVSIFHNLQYQGMTWGYNECGHRSIVRRNVLAYAVCGLAYTGLILGLGYWPVGTGSEWIGAGDGVLVWVLGGVTLGLAFVHYDLDGRIWRVSRDRKLQRLLGF